MNLSADLKRVLFEKRFAGGTVLMFLVCWVSAMESVIGIMQGAEIVSYGEFFGAVFRSQAVQFLAPILCTLPYTTAFIEDVNTGFVKFNLSRVRVRTYQIGKWLVCAIMGGLVLSVGGFLFLLTNFPLVASFAAGDPALSGAAGILLLQFLNGVMWSSLGLLAATVTNSKYMAYASPFVIYYLLVILHERYFQKAEIIDPSQWLVGGTIQPLGHYTIPVLLTAFSLLLGLAFYYCSKRRIERV